MKPLNKLPSVNFTLFNDQNNKQGNHNRRFLSSYTIFNSNTLSKKREDLFSKEDKDLNIDLEQSITTKRELSVPKPIQPSLTNIDGVLAELGLLNKRIPLNDIFIKTSDHQSKKTQRPIKTAYGSFRKLIGKEEGREEEAGEQMPLPDPRSEQYLLYLPYEFNFCKDNKTRILLRRKQKQPKRNINFRNFKYKRSSLLKKEIRKLKSFWGGRTKKIPFTFKIFDNKFRSRNYREEVIELSGKLVRPKNF